MDEVTGCSPSRFYAKLRVERAKALLEQTAIPVVEVHRLRLHFALPLLHGLPHQRGHTPIQTRRPKRSKKPYVKRAPERIRFRGVEWVVEDGGHVLRHRARGLHSREGAPNGAEGRKAAVGTRRTAFPC